MGAQRGKTAEGDLETLEAILEESERSANDELMLQIKRMQSGDFVGYPANHKLILAIQTKFDLDEQATNKMTEALVNLGKEKAKKTLKQLNAHLELSNKPSALVCKMLGKLRNGEDLGTPYYRAGEGSFADKQAAIEERKDEQRRAARKEQEKGSRSRSRSRSRDRDRRRRDDRDRDRDRDRNRDDGDKKWDDKWKNSKWEGKDKW